MPTSISNAQRHKVNQDPILPADAHLILLEFQEDGVSTVHRSVRNNEDITHNSNTYVATRIGVNLPSSGDQEPSCSLEMSNLSREPGKAINRAKGLVGCRMKMIDASLPDVAIIDTYNLMVLRRVSGNSISIKADLGSRCSFDEPVRPRRITRQYFPGPWFDV